MSHFTTASVIASILAIAAIVPSANAVPTGPDLLVGNYINPSASTQKVERTIAKVQDLLEIQCSNANPTKMRKCDQKKFANLTLVQIRKSTNLRQTLANLSGVKPAQVNKTQLTEVGYYQEVLQFQNGKKGNISLTAQGMLENFDLVDKD